jgi:hypothetical protein
VADNPYAPSPLGGAQPSVAPATTGYAYTPPATLAPAAPAAAPSTYKPSPIDIVVHNESGGRNITQQIHDINTVKGTPARGVAQIIDPTWRTYAGKAGIDLNRYPTAQSAPPAVQIQIASTIPFNQWGPATVAAVKNAYPNIDIRGKTLGQIQAEAGHAIPSAPSGATPSAAAAPPAPTSNAQKFADAYKSGNAGGMLAALSAGTGDKGEGKSALDSATDAMKGPQLPTPTPALPAIAQAPPDTAGASQQLLGQVLASQSQPLSWSAAPFGSHAGPQAVPGVTLNSSPNGVLSQYALNPMYSG